jgi:hypothetical protein
MQLDGTYLQKLDVVLFLVRKNPVARGKFFDSESEEE